VTPLGNVLAIYGIGINGLSYLLFSFDKEQAINHKWRVPEKTLHLTGFLGGWPAGLLAMSKLHHKNRKISFQNVYYCAIAGNLILLSIAGLKHTELLKHLQRLKILK